MEWPMSQDSRRPVWPILIVALIGLPVLYVASTGPAIWLLRRFNSDGLNDLALTVYAPVLWLYYHWEWFARCFDRWEDFWENF